MLVRSTARILTLAGALTGGAVVSQAPEFAQQYRQRIGGALQELNAVVADFDKDAAASDMTREQALTRYSRSPTGSCVTAVLPSIRRFFVMPASPSSVRHWRRRFR